MNSIQRGIAGAVFVLIASPVLQAQATAPRMEIFTGTTVNLNPGAGMLCLPRIWYLLTTLTLPSSVG